MPNIISAFILGLSIACLSPARAEKRLGKHIYEKEHNDLPEIIENRYFRVLTSRNSFDYHIYQGRPRGYQFELMKAFTKRLNKKYAKKGLKFQFELIPADYDELIPMLKAGQGDIIAANLTATDKRKESVSFSSPLREVEELLVTRVELKDRTPFQKRIALRKSSSYFESIKKWNQENPDRFFAVDLVDEDLTPEAIMEQVSLGTYDYALVDSNLYEVAKEVFDDLRLTQEQPFKGKPQQIALATRKDSKELLKELNAFVPKVKKGSLLGNIIDKKYFNDALLLKSSESSSRISPYDDLLKKYADTYDWDWKLLAALCFQESRFNQSIVNRWGAIGLFQIKQSTANEPYVDIPRVKGNKNAENNIHAGVKYLSWIREHFFGDLPKRRAIRLSLAAYNAGPTTVVKARELAQKMGLDSNIWFRNVELAMAKMKKSEPVDYVSQINKRYVGYSLLFPEGEED